MLIRIKEVPQVQNPNPRPTTASRPGTQANGRKTAGGSLNNLESKEIDSDLSGIYNSTIGAEQLIEASNGQRLEDIIRLSLRIDTSEKSICNMGDHVPNLRELVMDNSRIASLRDLGVSLRGLRVLSLNECGILELDGIAALGGLEVLFLKNNYIVDVSPIAMHDHITTLNLCGNKISEISVGDTLSSCPSLHSLDLSRNPIERAPNYRAVICALIPNLAILDGTPVDPSIRSKVTNAMILDASSAIKMIM